MILVTGSTGTVGREVVRALTRRGLAHRAAVREPPAIEPGHAGEAVRFDFEEASTHAAALDGVDRVFLLRPPALGRASQLQPFLDAVRAARSVRHVVFLSVRGADRSRLLPHHGIEKRVERLGLGWTHLRPNDFMQNFATVHASDIRDRGEIWAPAGKGRASFVDVRDVAEAAAAVLASPDRHAGCAHTLTGPTALDLHEVARLIGKARGRAVRYRDPSIPAFLAHGHRIGRPLVLSLVMSAIYTAQRLGWAEEISGDLGALLGRAPGTFEAFAHDFAAVWRAGEGASGIDVPA